MAPGKVAAVVLNWNNFEDTSNCIRELQELTYNHLEILVVDNHSTDGSETQIEEAFDDVQMLFNDENEGFAGGVNTGIRAALDKGVDYVWILNNDIAIPDNRFLQDLLKTFRQYPDAGIVSPRIQNYPEIDDVWFEEGRVNWLTGHAYHVNTSNWFIDWEYSRRTDRGDYPRDDIITNDYVPFCSAIIRAEVFEEIGVLPEQYFLYKEDADFCTRAIEHGYSVLTNRTVEIHHHVSNSTGGSTSPIHSYYSSRGMWLFRDEFRDRINPFIFVPWYCWWVTTRIAYNLLHNNLDSAHASIRGTLDGINKEEGNGPYP